MTFVHELVANEIDRVTSCARNGIGTHFVFRDFVVRNQNEKAHAICDNEQNAPQLAALRSVQTMGRNSSAIRMHGLRDRVNFSIPNVRLIKR